MAEAEAMISSWSTERAPGIGMTCGRFAKSHAIATAPTVAPLIDAMSARTARTGAMAFSD